MIPTSDTVRRTMRRLIPAVLAGVLLLVALGFLIVTVLLAFLEVMPAPFATLSTAAIVALAAGIFIAISRSGRKRRRLQSGSLVDELAPALHLAVGQRPLTALTVATVLGAVAEMAMKSGSQQPRRD